MDKRGIIISLLLISMIFLFSGCQKTEKVEGPERFLGTKEGVSLSFVSGKPLSQFSRGDSIPVEVVLKNGG